MWLEIKKIILGLSLISLCGMNFASNHYMHQGNGSLSTNDVLTTLSFNIAYSGDVNGVLEQVKIYDPNLHILQALGKIKKININLNLAGISIDDLSSALSNQTNGQVSIIYDGVHNFARLNYSDKLDVATDAVNESLKWQNGANPKPVLKQDGVVRFPYGEYQPTIVCQPLNLCDIELEHGEQIEGVVIGDSLRWNEGDQGIPIVYSGSGDSLTPHLVLKASQDGLDTTLLVTTSKRTYMIRLMSRNNGYVARSGFYYPDELVQTFTFNKEKLKNQLNNNENNDIVTNPEVKMPLLNLSKINYNYLIKGDDYVWKPIRVFDDGISVYIQMPDKVSSRSLPGLCIIPDGDNEASHCEMVNFRYNDHFYIVDKLFNQAVLMNGFDSSKEIVKIIRNPDKPGFWARLFGNK